MFVCDSFVFKMNFHVFVTVIMCLDHSYELEFAQLN